MKAECFCTYEVLCSKSYHKYAYMLHTLFHRNTEASFVKNQDHELEHAQPQRIS